MSSLALEEASTLVITVPVQLLIVEHSIDDVELILLELRKAGVQIHQITVESREQFQAALAKQTFDAVLCDYRLPTWTGMDALRELRAIDKNTPFLLVTGTLGEEAAVECIKQGVSDFVVKHHLTRLPLVLQRAIAEKKIAGRERQDRGRAGLSEARNRELVQNSILGICRVDAGGIMADCNPALLKIIGCTPQVLPALNFENDLFRFPEQYSQMMTSCRETGTLHGAEADWRRCDGRHIIVRLHLRFLYDPNRRRAIEVIVEDVSAFRAMERELRQAQKFEAIGQLAGGIAHDFNNVIGAILGWAELGLIKTPRIPRRRSVFGASANRRNAPPRSPGNCWPSLGNRFCSRGLST